MMFAVKETFMLRLRIKSKWGKYVDNVIENSS